MLARIEQFADVMHDSKLQIRKVHSYLICLAGTQAHAQQKHYIS